MTRVAVVGAGVAGLGVAYALRDSATVTLFERCERVGGRAATREQADCVYDTGANYVKSEEERVSRVIRELSDGLVDVEEPVWTFDAGETISEGRDEDTEKWTYRNGIGTLGQRLLNVSDATVRTNTRIVGIQKNEDDGWYVEDGGGNEHGPYDELVLTPPAPLTASLLEFAEWGDDETRRELREHIGHVPYRTILSVVLHYPFEIDRPYYALVNTDKEHEIGWLARESCKSGHVPDGESLLVVQMAPDWSAKQYDHENSEIVAAAADHVADLLSDHSLSAPDWFDVIRWRDALPDSGADADVLRRATEVNLYFAGDWVAGDGRVHHALGSGLDVGERIREE
ncbi:NAD(P)/FAD-dependent oxidoreductase [Haladaptatus cibarius]|uniref:NAD(P)/FAD-dependent oxidoreductase n=1 Tax=Haladaptatus cibarius TaxID=453847 RepID=UPI000679B3CD|nr:FAD-dependent oxidoreductase [Haladaptatus cibarius]